MNEMNKKRIVISCGPIPARLDSVKYITNKFKGGLAFKTASMIYNKCYGCIENLTIVKWVNTPLPSDIKELIDKNDNIKVVSIEDVFKYYDFYKENANNFDMFIMAGAVANLTPSNPYDGKFPSHNYKVGEKFNIEFEIAPRAIDIIKKLNPRATLIGYKLFDSKTDNELIDIARHTLSDSKANVIFANTPATAKTTKIAVTSDGAAITCTFEEHVDMICNLLENSFFKTKIIETTNELQEKILPYEKIIEHYESTFNGFGTIAIRVPETGGIVTTTRGHKNGVTYIEKIDFATNTIYATKKATLNAPLLFTLLNRKNNFGEYYFDYIIHRHEIIEDALTVDYVFPGTKAEVCIAEWLNFDVRDCFNIKNHGYIWGQKFSEVDWNKYYELFPEKYFSIPDAIENEIKLHSKHEILDVGANKNPCGYFMLDPYVSVENVTNLTYEHLKENWFELIVIKNAINYLSKKELTLLQKALKPNGILIANTFFAAPNLKVTDNEVSFCNNSIVNHFLFVNDNIYKHCFNGYNVNFYQKMNFEIFPYGKNSAIVKYTKKQ